ncbi:MAG: hypothetical protein ACR2QT_10500 [Woeseiaceae bacterium]
MTLTRNVMLVGLLLSTWVAAASADDKPIDEAQLEADGAVIGNIVLTKHDVFDLTDERENNFLYRLINRMHIITKDDVIEKQLLLKPGEPYSKRLADETERILRRRIYLYDATIEPVNLENGIVDLHITTKDVWTLKPGITASRKGGENRSGVDLEELNLFGGGQEIRIARIDDIDRTSKSFEFRDPHIKDSWFVGSLNLADNSDGHSNFASLIRPFYALDTRWSFGASGFDDEHRTALYSQGEEAAEFQHEHELYSLFGGWSAGLQDGWVRRYRAGITIDDNKFGSVADGSLPAIVPADRRLIYPFVGVEILQDEFEKTNNKEQIGRTEDFFMGQRFSATLGYSTESLSADRNALMYAASYSRGFGSLQSKALLTSAWTNGRMESGDSKNALFGFDARFYFRQSEKRMFFATLEGVHGHALDVDTVVELGGETGLRGYPLRYQNGDAKLLLTMEQRFFWDWYPFRLFRVGGAVFADAGRVWGENAVGEPEQRWLRDVGFGLRFAPTRSGFGKIVHLDIAFPLDGDASIDDVQILLESKSSF